MGKLSTAARYARSGNKTKKTSIRKLANKRHQRTPKRVRKQLNRAKLSRKEELEQIKGKTEKRLKKWNFKNFTKDIKDELHGNDNQNSKKQQISRSQRNKFSRQNKKLQKQQERISKKDIDFSTYDREIEQEISSEEEEVNDFVSDDEEDEQDIFLQNVEMSHQPRSYDTRKSKLPYKSESGQWVVDSEQIDKHYIERERDNNDSNDNKNGNGNDGVVVTENEIADYLNLGKVNEETKEDEDEDDDDDDDIDMEDKNSEQVPIKKMTPMQWKLKKKQRVNQLKLEIADIGEKILEDPYKNCSLLHILFNLCEDADAEICQYAMLSLTRGIIDIMPPYKIGTIDANIALKQRNERVREFEKILLNTYQSYLKHIFQAARIYHSNTRNKTKKRDPKRFILGKCAVKCILLFIRKCSHFNYTKELIKNTIPLTNCNVEEIRKDACSAIVSLLTHEPINNVTVECVQMICQRIEKKNFAVYPNIIYVLAALPLRHLEPPQDDYKEGKIKSTKSRWEKQFEKQQKKDAKEMAGLDKKKMFSRQKVIIECVFGVYFYILKLEVATNLLEAALRGISKFVHLVNIELILDLISVVSEKLEKEKHRLSLQCKLRCILTTFKCLSGRGTSIEMDVKAHYSTIYQLLLSVTLNIYEWNNFGLIFECLGLMFGRHASKSVSIDRIASFVKRLINISTQLPPHYAVACQHQARKLIVGDPRLYNMLHFEGGCDREYHPNESNPDHSNSLSCCLWELTNTSNHYHSFNKIYSRDLASWSEIPVKLSITTPNKVMSKYDITYNGNFRPFVVQSKLSKFSMIKHPPNDLDNNESMKNMVNWFKINNVNYKNKRNKRYQNRMNKITKAVINGNKMADKAIKFYGECGDLISRNRILTELNDEYKLLNRLLQSD